MTSAPMFKRVLIFGGILTAVIAIVGSMIGYLIAGGSGVLSAIAGAASSAVFLSLTAASFLVAGKVTRSMDAIGGFFGIVVGTWLVKLVVFIGVVIWIGGQSWLVPGVFAVAVLVAVIGLLIVDVIAFQTSRVPYVDVSLPGENANLSKKTPPIS